MEEVVLYVYEKAEIKMVIEGWMEYRIIIVDILGYLIIFNMKTLL